MQPRSPTLLWDARRADGLSREVPEIVAFRNTIVHRYADVDDALFWQVDTVELPPLIEPLTDALVEATE